MMTRFWSMTIIMVLVGALLFLGVPLVREASVRWYEIDFEARATIAAAKVAGDNAYCIYDEDRNILATTFAELDTGKMLSRAFNSHIGLSGGNRAYWPKPHFRILIAGDTYWYSFKKRAFLKFHPQRWQLTDQLQKLCSAYRSSPRDFRAAIQQRHGITVTEANFCCPAAS